MTWPSYDPDRHETVQDDDFGSQPIDLEGLRSAIDLIREAQRHKPEPETAVLRTYSGHTRLHTGIMLCTECHGPWPCPTRQALNLLRHPRYAPGGISPGYLIKRPPPEPDPVPQSTGWWARLRPAIQRFLDKEAL